MFCGMFQKEGNVLLVRGETCVGVPGVWNCVRVCATTHALLSELRTGRQLNVIKL